LLPFTRIISIIKGLTTGSRRWKRDPSTIFSRIQMCLWTARMGASVAGTERERSHAEEEGQRRTQTWGKMGRRLWREGSNGMQNGGDVRDQGDNQTCGYVTRRKAKNHRDSPSISMQVIEWLWE
jgi:hypothetical protein